MKQLKSPYKLKQTRNYDLNNQIFFQMKALKSPYRVIAMGKTGSGKSTLLNSLAKHEAFRVGNSIFSETSNVNSHCGKFRNRSGCPDIVFIDTPGFFDSSAKDNEIIAKIAVSLRKIEDGVNLVLFCIPAFEIRIDATLQASIKFLKLVMGKAVYENVIIVLTHGNRLAPEELENAVFRMTRGFIPYIRNNLKCRVKDEILIFNKDAENDGLEDVLRYITESKKYCPRIMEDLGKFWDDTDPIKSIENLLQNSSFFKKIQDMLRDSQDRSQVLEGQVADIQKKIDSLSVANHTPLKSIENSLSLQKKDIDNFKDKIGAELQKVKKQLEEKDNFIGKLFKNMEEMKGYISHRANAPAGQPRPVPSHSRDPGKENKPPAGRKGLDSRPNANQVKKLLREKYYGADGVPIKRVQRPYAHQ